MKQSLCFLKLYLSVVLSFFNAEKVIGFVGKTEINLFRCDAIVDWGNAEGRNGKTVRYLVGREGIAELLCDTSAHDEYIYEDHLPRLTKENVKIGLRVVKISNENESVSELGTIVSFGRKGDKKEGSVSVRWDCNKKDKIVPLKELRIYDNGPIGIRHPATCNSCGNEELIKGIRWKCSKCTDYDLCTKCYMADKDDLNHPYQRKEKPDPHTPGQTSTKSDEFKRENGKKQRVKGILRGSNVVSRKETDVRCGEVKDICNYKTTVARHAVYLKTEEGKIKAKISELKSEPKQEQLNYYYPNHLPDLGNDIFGYLKLDYIEKEIIVKVRYLQKENEKCLERPRLHFIIAEKNCDKEKLEDKIREIHSISKRDKVPCHLVEEKILIFEDIVVVHEETTEPIFKVLLDMDCFEIITGKITSDEKDLKSGSQDDGVKYFHKMAECCCGDLCLPVVISLKEGKRMKTITSAAREERIPIISFKRESVFGVVRTYINPTERKDNSKTITYHHICDVRLPWAAKRFKENNSKKEQEIRTINDLENFGNLTLDILVCNMLVGVSMAEPTVKLFGDRSEIFPNALSMQLMKNGKWKIPKAFITAHFTLKSIEYIYEQKMKTEFESGLWKDLYEKTEGAFKPPFWKKQESPSNKKFDIKISDLYGLIFYALLRRNFFEGAKQLIEAGGVRIHHILVGCVILEEKENDWRATQIEKEKTQQLHRIFSHHVLRILRCIHANDNADRPKDKQLKDPNGQKEVGEHVQHAGRLLLNHGYLTDIIKTKNTTVLGDNTVKDILNQMWYGKKSLSISRILLFALLTLLHVIILPVLMITMEHKPLRWLYRQYQIPVMKVLLNLTGLLTLLAIYAYMLLFDFEENKISISDAFIIVWMVSVFIGEIKQMAISMHREKFLSYVRDKWNILDWTSLGAYFCGMFLKVGEGSIYSNTSRVFLVLAFIMLCIRVLNLFCISELLGPKLVMIQKMFVDTFAFMAIMMVITFCYNVSYYAILYSENSNFSFEQCEKITKNGFWILFGELNLETDILREPDCTYNKTIYMSGAMERCPSELGRSLAPYLKAAYGLVAVILMLNLLIAMYSYSFSKVQEKSELYWSRLQRNFLEEYSVKTIFPIHMQLFALLAMIFQMFVWFIFPYFFRSMKKCCRKYLRNGRNESKDADKEPDNRLNDSPMFVRVFLYNTNFDVKLSTTPEAEATAALSIAGEINFEEKDKLTVLQDEMKELGKAVMRKFEQINEIKSLLESIKKENETQVTRL